jgi:hypothetical protein
MKLKGKRDQATTNRSTYKAMRPVRKTLFSSGRKNIIPAAKRVQAMLGKVASSKDRRPNVSMVKMAGKAKTKLTAPNPSEAKRA